MDNPNLRMSPAKQRLTQMCIFGIMNVLKTYRHYLANIFCLQMFIFCGMLSETLLGVWFGAQSLPKRGGPQPNEAHELTTNHHIDLSGKSAFLALKDKHRNGHATRELSSQRSCEVASRFKDGDSQLAKLEVRHSTLQLLRTDVVKQLRCVMCAGVSRGL